MAPIAPNALAATKNIDSGEFQGLKIRTIPLKTSAASTTTIIIQKNFTIFSEMPFHHAVIDKIINSLPDFNFPYFYIQHHIQYMQLD